MSSISEPFAPDKSKSRAEQLNDIFNHIRTQLDFLCGSAEYQNAILKEIYKNSCNRCNQCENCDNQSPHGNA